MTSKAVLVVACTAIALGFSSAPAHSTDITFVATGASSISVVGDTTGTCVESFDQDFESFEASWIQSDDIEDAQVLEVLGYYPDPGDLGQPRLVATLQPGNVQVSCSFGLVEIHNNDPANLNNDSYSVEGSDCTCNGETVNFALIFLKDSTGTALESDMQPTSLPEIFAFTNDFPNSLYFRIESLEPSYDIRLQLDEIYVLEPSTPVPFLSPLVIALLGILLGFAGWRRLRA